MTPINGVGALRQPGRPLGRDPCHGSHPVVGGIVRVSCRSVFGRWVSYPLPPLCGVVLLVRYDAGLTFDRTELTVVTSVLAGSVRRAFIRTGMSRGAQLLPVSPRGRDGKRSRFLASRG
jgi:hypothetical protein